MLKDRQEIKLNKYGFEDGVSGWLSPEGVFTNARYGEHANLAYKLEETDKIKVMFEEYTPVHGERLLELSGYIKFVCPDYGCNGDNSYIFFPQSFGCKMDITDKQLNYLLFISCKLSTNQLRTLEEFLKSC